MYILLLVFSLITIYLHRTDLNFSNNWLIFFLWLLNLLIACIYLLLKVPKSFYKQTLLILKQESRILACIVILALFTRFILLSIYPYVSLGDELANAGYGALKIYQGYTKDFFDFGSYHGYGNFIPLISFFFSLAIKNNTLIYLIPSAMVGSLSIIFAYILGRVLAGKEVAVLSSLFLIGSLSHLHYSRTELLVVIDSLLAILVVLSTYSAIHSRKGFFLAGLMYGLSLHFYVGIKGLLAICFLYLFFVMLIKLIHALTSKNNHDLIPHLKTFILGFSLFLIGFIIGLGPTINRINQENISTSGNTQLITTQDTFLQKNMDEKITFLGQSYIKAFSVYIFEPTVENVFHFTYNDPLLSFPVNWLFLLGFFFLVFRKNKEKILTGLLVFIVVLFPITNQVIINQIGANHRLMGIVPILNIVAAFGLVKLLEYLRFTRYKKYILAIIVVIFLSYQLFFYFFYRPSDIKYGVKEYIFQNVLAYIRDDKQYQTYYILNDEIYNFDFLHYHEKTEFYTYPKEVDLLDEVTFLKKRQGDTISSRNSYLVTRWIPELDTYSKKSISVHCQKQVFLPDYRCPLNFVGDYSFYVLEY